MIKLNIRLEKDWLGYQQIYIDDCYIDEYKEGEENNITTLFDDGTAALLVKLGFMEEISDYEDELEVKEVYDMLFKKLQNGVEITII